MKPGDSFFEVPACDQCDERGRHLCAPRADRVQRFYENVLVHTKGRSAGKPFILTDWQRDEIVRPIFGTVRYSEFDGYVRAYSLGWIEMARKNGKSELLSGAALYFLCADGEESAEVYSVAVDRDQASLVFNVAKRMVELSPILRKELEVIDSRKRIIHRPTNSVYTVLPGDAAGALGTNPHAVLFDEVLTQKDRHLWDAMRQGMGARSQPFMLAATTASYTSAEFCLEEHKYSERVAKRRAQIAEGKDLEDYDPSRFVFMRNTPKDADWTDEANWYYANPALGDFLSIETLRNEAREAKENPAAQNAFRVFRLNQWVSQSTRWLDMNVWDDNGIKGGPVLEDMLSHRECWIGLDLAAVSDFTAMVLLFRGMPEDEDAPGFTVLPRFFVPRVMIERRKDMREKFDQWEAQGFLTVTEGNVTDYSFIEAQLRKDMESFNVRAIGFDPWNAPALIQRIEADGEVTAVKVNQSPTRLNEPCKALDATLSRRQLAHGNNPVLRWHADNVEAEFTPDGYMKPSKRHSADKIDGIAALVNAFYVEQIPTEEPATVGFISF